MSYQSLILQELNQAASVLSSFLTDKNNLAKIEEAAVMIAASIKSGGKVISCGNGGFSL